MQEDAFSILKDHHTKFQLFSIKLIVTNISQAVNSPIVIHPQTNIGFPDVMRWNHPQDHCTQIHHREQHSKHLTLSP